MFLFCIVLGKDCCHECGWADLKWFEYIHFVFLSFKGHKMARVIECKYEERMKAFIYLSRSINCPKMEFNIWFRLAVTWNSKLDCSNILNNLRGWSDVFGEVLKHESGREWFWGKGDLDWANLNLHKPVKNMSYCPMYYPLMINVNWKYVIMCDIHACCKSFKNKPYMIYLN